MTPRRRALLVIGVGATLAILVAMGWVLADRAGLFLARGHASVPEFYASEIKLRDVRDDLVVTLLRNGRTVRLERMTMPRLGILSPRRLLWEIDFQEAIAASPCAGYAFSGPALAARVGISESGVVGVGFG